MLPEEGLSSCLTAYQMKETIPAPLQLKSLKLWMGQAWGVCIHLHLNDFVFLGKTKLLTITPVFGIAQISCLALDCFGLPPPRSDSECFP